MSEPVTIALIGLVGLVIVQLLVIIGQQLAAKTTATQRHADNTSKLTEVSAALDTANRERAEMGRSLARLHDELPPGGLAAWTETIAAHTEQLRRGSIALDRLAESMTTVTERLDVHEAAIEALRAGAS